MCGSGASECRLIDDIIIRYNPVLNCTPGSNSVQHAVNRNLEKAEAPFSSVVEELFKGNPFTDGIPEVYTDITLEALRGFLHRRNQPNRADSSVFALILAMPGSGKTRTVVEAARETNYHRLRMTNKTVAKFGNAQALEDFLETKVSEICGGGPIPKHRDEVRGGPL